VASGHSAVVFLTASLNAGSGGLSVQAGASVTLDLGGCDLSITSPGNSAAAIAVPATSSLTVEDTTTYGGALATLTVTGGQGVSGGGGAGIGGAGAGNGDGADAGSVTITGVNLIATGGDGGGTVGGGGAAVGGGGGGGTGGGITHDGGSLAGQVVIGGGTVTVNGGGAANLTGGAAAIGGGGGSGSSNATGSDSPSNYEGGGLTGSVTINGGLVSALGGTSARAIGGGIFYSDGAAIGGGSGGAGAYGGDGGSVTLTGGQVSAPSFHSAHGIGSGGVPELSSQNGTVTVPSGSVTLTGEDAAVTTTVAAGATLSVPAGTTLAMDGFSNNYGTIQLGGTLGGGGQVANYGSITVSGNGWSADNQRPGSVYSATALITGNVYAISFSVPSGISIPDEWVFAPTLAASGESLPSLPYVSWVSGSTVVSPTTVLQQFSPTTRGTAATQRFTLTAQYSSVPKITTTLSSVRPQSRFGWWHTPVTVTFACTPLPGVSLSAACPGPVVLSASGTQQVTRSVDVSNGSVASAAATVKIDRSRPTVRITGATNHGYYHRHAPKVRCKATEQPSGIASCKLTIRRRRLRADYVETVRATAITKAGETRTATVSFTVAKR
jgi:hypothetical protein